MIYVYSGICCCSLNDFAHIGVVALLYLAPQGVDVSRDSISGDSNECLGCVWYSRLSKLGRDNGRDVISSRARMIVMVIAIVIAMMTVIL